MNIKDTLRVMMPDFWVMIHSYNSRWDKLLNEAIDKGDISLKGEYICVVGGLKVWISGFPHSYGTPYTLKLYNVPRPARRTVLRLKRLLENCTGTPEDDIINAAIVKI